VASGVKCRSHGGENSKTKSWTVSWLSLKTKVAPGRRGGQVMSGDWRRPHQVHGVLLTVNMHIKVCLDLQADKSSIVVKGPFFP
jgi:hypothetical protein